mmetsp:Transcript_30318/g.58053  ORF Transcript_30318/g.58053 Transcript_30318/m.58053 type:complete len:257 (-) Transcript_30318:486-1256(-)
MCSSRRRSCRRIGNNTAGTAAAAVLPHRLPGRRVGALQRPFPLLPAFLAAALGTLHLPPFHLVRRFPDERGKEDAAHFGGGNVGLTIVVVVAFVGCVVIVVVIIIVVIVIIVIVVVIVLSSSRVGKTGIEFDDGIDAGFVIVDGSSFLRSSGFDGVVVVGGGNGPIHRIHCIPIIDRFPPSPFGHGNEKGTSIGSLLLTSLPRYRRFCRLLPRRSISVCSKLNFQSIEQMIGDGPAAAKKQRRIRCPAPSAPSSLE